MRCVTQKIIENENILILEFFWSLLSRDGNLYVGNPGGKMGIHHVTEETSGRYYL